MRLDKYLTSCHVGSRKEVNQFIRYRRVKVNHIVQTNNRFSVQEKLDQVEVDDIIIPYQPYYYYLLNKPKGYICSTADSYQKTIMELFRGLNQHLVNKLFPVGRLDIDTEGMIIVTNDGKFFHQLTSPRHHIKKVYWVEYDKKLPDNAQEMLAKQITLPDGTTYQPAFIEIIDEKHAYITIMEGQFHEVKRLIQYLGSNVTSLKRIKIGNLSLPNHLEVGMYDELNEEDILKLLEKETENIEKIHKSM